MSGSQSPQKIKTLLVDDEEIAIHRLKKALQHHPQITIIGEATSGSSAITAINTQQPDLVFLDIQMPEINGFEVLTHLTHTPLIVFVTAYEEYAIQAFEKNSLDYLLKPVENHRLAITIKRILDNKAGHTSILQKIAALVSTQPAKNTITTIPVKTGTKINLVHVADICFLEAKDKYVYLHTHDEAKLIEYPLTWLQDRLPNEFVRIHRSLIINKLKIREIHKYFKGTYIITINDAKGTRLKTAYSYNDTIHNKLLQP